VVEKRPPLGEHARRAGWVGCVIRLDRIPCDGEIAVVEGGAWVSKAFVRNKFRRFLPLETLAPERRGWATLTLSVIRTIGKARFSLADLYEREEEFAAIYPGNRHIRPKIRQQLQVLRDLGVLSFEGSGSYRMLA
jgi:type II restriction enzyme